jgi:Na+(H+)/acetate symporter ActP
MLAALDPWILAFSLVTVAVTIWMGFRSAKSSKSASDFFVAGRSVSVGWNASAISGEYLSAASFMGVAGMVMSSGYDALWYPVCYACGYLFLLLFIAGPLRRFGAYTIPDFAEGRYDSPLFRKIAVIFVLFIGFFYTMPQMKGAGTTLAYIFPGLPYWVGVVLVGAVITLNVALGGMKGITLVQAFQYWAKMFAISVPIFVLMAVYGHYGKQLNVNTQEASAAVRAMQTLSTNASFHESGIEANGTIRKPLPEKAPADSTWLSPFGPLTTKAAKAAKLSAEESKPYSLLYTYSLIIALVCGTAGLPHILVRFYTNPDGVAAKRTTMWVMILIGIFYVFPPVFGVMGRNLMPSLYEGTGAKGTDKVVLELPKVLDAKGGGIWKAGKKEDGKTGAGGSVPSSSTPVLPSSTEANPGGSKGIPWGSILSGITCAGAFAAFMSTFSGLLVSMTGALAHDVYGRMLRPQSTPAERMRMFKFCAVGVGTVAVVLGSFVEPLQINFMVGQAFAIAAASYFPLLFMSVWWRGMTMRGAAAGMLTGGVCALAAVTLTNFSDLKWLPLADFWAAHPLLRILCEQPAIWTVPLAIGLMVLVSKLTRAGIPADVRMKMLVLHAPEKLGLKQEYIKEHEAHGH